MPADRARRVEGAVEADIDDAVQRSVGISTVGTRAPTPALLTRTSMRPSRSSASATTRSTSASIATSSCHAAAVPPSPAITLAVSSALSSSMSVTATAAPSRAKA
ncbi:MAG TPA: hypothetical protein VKA80_04080, partial [Beijerinckiaceae bacterium]|nr:hypothetical protein [Beijerinckiaceae bacterium]